MQAISVFDTLTFTPSDTDTFTCTNSGLETASNLVLRARDAFGMHRPVHIHLEKKIPIQAGLGGGSSNAATTLFALNEMNGLPYTNEQLMEIGATLGADVPFFLSSGVALCTGIGDVVSPSDISFSGWILKPMFGVSTEGAYQGCIPSLDGDLELFENDLERGVFASDARMASIKEELERVFDKVVMTGSGSAFFCIGTMTNAIAEKYTTFHVEPVRRNVGKWYDVGTKHVVHENLST